jgi:hypothetical protein
MKGSEEIMDIDELVAAKNEHMARVGASWSLQDTRR